MSSSQTPEQIKKELKESKMFTKTFINDMYASLKESEAGKSTELKTTLFDDLKK